MLSSDRRQNCPPLDQSRNLNAPRLADSVADAFVGRTGEMGRAGRVSCSPALTARCTCRRRGDQTGQPTKSKGRYTKLRAKATIAGALLPMRSCFSLCERSRQDSRSLATA